VLEDVKVHRVSMRPEQTGVVLQWTADAPGLNDATRGKLTGLKSTDIQMTLRGPELAVGGQGQIPGTAKDAAAPAAGNASKAALDASGANPFGTGAGAKSDEDVRNEALANGTPVGAKGRKASSAAAH
jgi:hypothetical protein